MVDSMPRVLVTGGTGYIAQHIILVLQKEGYRVRVTIRNLNDKDKIQFLCSLYSEACSPLEIVEANLLYDEGWTEAVAGCTYVVHVASPVPKGIPNNGNHVIKPAVEGTKRVLRACAKAGTVRRLVLTSSVSAVHGEWITDSNTVYTEQDWTDLNSPFLTAYARSKTIAENVAWNYVHELYGSERFELATINPGLVLGPVFSKEVPSSVEVIYRMMDLCRMPLVPKVNLCVCDVRDVALAHLRAMILPEAAGHRHLVTSGNIWMADICKILAEEFSSRGYTIPRWPAPYGVMWLYSFFDASAALLTPRIGQIFLFDNQRMKSVLKIAPKNLRHTILDTAHSLIDHGNFHERKVNCATTIIDSVKKWF